MNLFRLYSHISDNNRRGVESKTIMGRIKIWWGDSDGKLTLDGGISSFFY